MRRGEVAPAPSQCSRCGAAATLIDLSNRDMAAALVGTESHDRNVHASRHRVIGAPLVQTLVLAALATAAFIAGLLPAGAVLTALGAERGLTTHRRIVAQGEAPTHARRWAHQERPAAPVETRRGHATGQPRLAPLTGQPCVAYDVRAVWCGESPDVLRSLALHEQVTDTLCVGRSDATRAYLELQPRPLSHEEVLTSPRALQYLASRGLEPSDGPFDYYETLVVEGDEVALLHDAQGRLGVRV